jgi:pSer/pThr/pTyr-binding forkhead associated (FHA) protein
MAKLIISRDGNVIDNRFIEQGTITIGAASDNDLQLRGIGVSRRHARIASVANDDILEDLGSANGTRVNGEPVKQRVLKHDDIIEISGFEIRYRNHKAVDGPSFDKTMIIEPTAIDAEVVGTGEVVARSRRRQRASYANGRAASLRDLNAPSDGMIEIAQLLRTVGDAATSLAVINARPHGYFITHVIGAKPARVNGTAIGSEPRALAHDDLIEVGNERLRFVCE